MRNRARFLGALWFSAAAAASAATYTVTTAIDNTPGSLRQAILDSNASVGVLDTIAFDIPGTGPFMMLLGAPLPTVTDPVIIDGTTQAGYAGTPLFQIRQGLFNGTGLAISGGGTTVRGLAFSDLATGLQLGGGGNTVEACFIGTNPAGTQAFGNGIGILIDSNGNLVGGTTASARNLISGNVGYGVRIVGGNDNLIRGNRIGTKVDGTQPLANQAGVSLSGGSGNSIGGTAAGAGNVISGNTVGIDLTGSTATLVAGNRIGTDATGTLAIENTTGIQVAGSAALLKVGGTTASARNVVSGNVSGIVLNGGDGAEILGNFVGVDAGGTLPLPNGFGITVNSTAVTDTRIGGTAAGEANVVAFNQTGIWNLGTRTTIRGNSIHDNDALGIDQDVAGPTPNDPTEGDASQNFPLVGSVDISALAPGSASVRVKGVLQTDPGSYTLDFYANPPCSENPQDYLEGETWLGTSPLTVDGSGLTAYDVTLPVAVAAGSRISATATDATGRTSEFSQRLPFTITPSTGPAGTAVQVFGTNFENGLTATIGGIPMTNIAFGATVFFNAKAPAVPGGIWDVTVVNPSGRTGTIPRAWSVDFADVPPAHQFYSYISILVRHGITAGVGGGSYGSSLPTLRQQMAVFLLKALNGICYVPPPCAGIFGDVPCPSAFADWVEAFAAAGITTGCGGGLYCPANPVRRDQMAVFLLKAEHGSAYVPPPCTGMFGDVACPSSFADWIEQLAAENITGGCGGGNYCPGNPNTRGQMAVFIVKTFNLQ